jgi:hypothetical protein
MHFVTKLVLAAPESVLPSLLTALSSQHFFYEAGFGRASERFTILTYGFCCARLSQNQQQKT